MKWLTAVAILVCLVKSGHADNEIGVAVELVAETSQLKGKLLIGVAESDESFKYVPRLLAYRAWFTMPWWKGKLIPSLALRLPYSGARENQPDFNFGYLVEPAIGFEYSLGLTDKIDAPLGARAGIPILIPAGDFQRQINLQSEVGSIGGPRFGWLVGATGGLRRTLPKKFAIRFDISLEFSQVYLFATRAEINGEPYARDWNTSVTRLSLALGIERKL